MVRLTLTNPRMFSQSLDMRRFYIVGHPPESEIGNALTLEAHEWCGFNYLNLMRGVPTGTLPGNLSFRVSQTSGDAAGASVIVCPFGWKVITSDLAESLKASAPTDVEMVEVPAVDHLGAALPKKFYAINALRIVDALSEKKTVRSPLALGDAKPVLKPFINEARVPAGVHVFRLKGDENRLLVDEVGKKALSAFPHDGLTFIPVEVE